MFVLILNCTLALGRNNIHCKTAKIDFSTLHLLRILVLFG